MTSPLPDLADLADFKLWPGVIVEADEEPSAEYVLMSASALIRVESGDPDRWPDGTAIPVAVRSAAVQVAARAWRNPSCSALVVTGPFTDQFAQGIVDALYLTEVEKRTIALTIRRPKLWTLTTQRDDDETAESFLPVTGYDDPFMVSDRFGYA